ncbi:MAG: DUF2304 domain-containing protein [Deltaproteobacteria bacterium]|nr:DUF2304 domain-containing protein [Deltaproteobacteria bacterium]
MTFSRSCSLLSWIRCGDDEFGQRFFGAAAAAGTNHQIKEKYSFLWFITCISLLALTLKRAWLTHLAAALGVYYPPTALFLVLSFFMIVMLVHFSMVVSKLLTQNQKLAQKVALLEAEISFKDGADPSHDSNAA